MDVQHSFDMFHVEGRPKGYSRQSSCVCQPVGSLHVPNMRRTTQAVEAGSLKSVPRLRCEVARAARRRLEGRPIHEAPLRCHGLKSVCIHTCKGKSICAGMHTGTEQLHQQDKMFSKTIQMPS